MSFCSSLWAIKKRYNLCSGKMLITYSKVGRSCFFYSEGDGLFFFYNAKARYWLYWKEFQWSILCQITDAVTKGYQDQTFWQTDYGWLVSSGQYALEHKSLHSNAAMLDCGFELFDPSPHFLMLLLSSVFQDKNSGNQYCSDDDFQIAFDEFLDQKEEQSFLNSQLLIYLKISNALMNKKSF